MERLVLAATLVALAVLVAWLVQRRKGEPTRAPTFQVPDAIDRSMFERPDAPWLVVVFTSASCDTCSAVVEKARALQSDAVAVQDVEARAGRTLHEQYAIDAVPLVVVADEAGVVRRHFFGPVPASDLWAALAELRD